MLIDTGEVGGGQVAMNDAGAAVIGWTQRASWEEMRVYASLYTPGEGWGEGELLAAAGTNVQVAIDDEGNALVIWEGIDAEQPAPNLWTRRYTVGVGWEETDPVDPDDTDWGSLPSIAMAADGSALAVWSDYGSTEARVQSSHYEPGGGWGDTVPIGVGTWPEEWS